MTRWSRCGPSTAAPRSGCCGCPMTATSCWSPMTSPAPSRRAASPTTRPCGKRWTGPDLRAPRGSRSSRMSEPSRVPRPGRSRSRPSPASLGVVKVDADFADEYPGADASCTEAYASLVRTGQALLGEIERSIWRTAGIPHPAATALTVIDGAGEPLTPSQVSDRVLVASATMTATLDLLEHRGWIRRIPNPADQLLPGIRAVEKSILSALTPAERAQLLHMLAKILARTADVAAGQPEPPGGQRNRPARLGSLPQQT